MPCYLFWCKYVLVQHTQTHKAHTTLWMDQDQEDLHLCKLSTESEVEGVVHGCDSWAHASIIQLCFDLDF
jgi:hypothetical protein